MSSMSSKTFALEDASLEELSEIVSTIFQDELNKINIKSFLSKEFAKIRFRLNEIHDKKDKCKIIANPLSTKESDAIQTLDKFRFQVDVLEGSDFIGSFTSSRFKTFAETYKALKEFNSAKHWPNLKQIQSMWILNGDKKILANNFQINICDLALLGINEFDQIIADKDSSIVVDTNQPTNPKIDNQLMGMKKSKAIKEQSKAGKEASKEQSKADKEASKEQSKADKEASKDQPKAGKEASKEQSKAGKEASKEQSKADKEASKEQSKADKEASKEQLKVEDVNKQSKVEDVNKQSSKMYNLIFTVVGMRYNGNHIFTAQDHIQIEADDNNPYDRNAVKIMVKKAEEFIHVAYAAREDCLKLRKAMKENDKCTAYFIERYAQSAKLTL